MSWHGQTSTHPLLTSPSKPPQLPLTATPHQMQALNGLSGMSGMGGLGGMGSSASIGSRALPSHLKGAAAMIPMSPQPNGVLGSPAPNASYATIWNKQAGSGLAPPHAHSHTPNSALALAAGMPSLVGAGSGLRRTPLAFTGPPQPPPPLPPPGVGGGGGAMTDSGVDTSRDDAGSNLDDSTDDASAMAAAAAAARVAADDNTLDGDDGAGGGDDDSAGGGGADATKTKRRKLSNESADAASVVAALSRAGSVGRGGKGKGPFVPVAALTAASGRSTVGGKHGPTANHQLSAAPSNKRKAAAEPKSKRRGGKAGGRKPRGAADGDSDDDADPNAATQELTQLEPSADAVAAAANTPLPPTNPLTASNLVSLSVGGSILPGAGLASARYQNLLPAAGGGGASTLAAHPFAGLIPPPQVPGSSARANGASAGAHAAAAVARAAAAAAGGSKRRSGDSDDDDGDDGGGGAYSDDDSADDKPKRKARGGANARGRGRGAKIRGGAAAAKRKKAAAAVDSGDDESSDDEDDASPALVALSGSVVPNVNSLPTLASVKKSRARDRSKSQKGLRHFSLKVCEKVQQQRNTTYNKVADELVKELTNPETAGIGKKTYDEKNIRRRVYDALNVLMALDIIAKEKKKITWNGLPTQLTKQLDDATSRRVACEARIAAKREQLSFLLADTVLRKQLMARNEAAKAAANAAATATATAAGAASATSIPGVKPEGTNSQSQSQSLSSSAGVGVGGGGGDMKPSQRPSYSILFDSASAAAAGSASASSTAAASSSAAAAAAAAAAAGTANSVRTRTRTPVFDTSAERVALPLTLVVAGPNAVFTPVELDIPPSDSADSSSAAAAAAGGGGGGGGAASKWLRMDFSEPFSVHSDLDVMRLLNLLRCTEWELRKYIPSELIPFFPTDQITERANGPAASAAAGAAPLNPPRAIAGLATQSIGSALH